MSGKIFISYRREDSEGHAGRIYDRLEKEFGRDHLFMDVDSIPPGENFSEVLGVEVAKCDVLLAMIGRNWIDVRDERGNRRLDAANDFVRIEISVALNRDIPVIPILLQGAPMPKSEQLPDNLKALSLRNGLDVRHASFDRDTDKLLMAIRGIFAKDAVQVLAKAMELWRSLPPLPRRGGHGEAYGNAKRETMLTFDKAVWLDPKSPDAYYQRGRFYLWNGDSRGLADFDKAIQFNPLHLETYKERAYYYFTQKNWTRAIADFDQVILLEPGRASSYEVRGICHAWKGDWVRAIADYNEAIRLNSSVESVYRHRGNAYAAIGEHTRAAEDQAKAAEIEARPRAKGWNLW